MSELFLYTHFIDEPEVSFLFFSELKKYCYLNLSTDLKDIFFIFAHQTLRAQRIRRKNKKASQFLNVLALIRISPLFK